MTDVDPTTEQSSPPVPASIREAWGLRERPAKGPRPGLSLERIVAAAITVAGRDGLAAVSMSRVAAELGSSPMSLYRYVAAKDELLALMFDAATGTPPRGPDLAQGWRPGLRHWTTAVFAAYRSHPWAVRIPISGPPITPNQTAWLEVALGYLKDSGLSEQEKLSCVLLLSGFVRNQASMVADFVEAIRAGASPGQVAASYGRTLAGLIDPAQFPFVSAAIASGSLDDETPPDGEPLADELAFGLERILDGIDVLIRSRS